MRPREQTHGHMKPVPKSGPCATRENGRSTACQQAPSRPASIEVALCNSFNSFSMDCAEVAHLHDVDNEGTCFHELNMHGRNLWMALKQRLMAWNMIDSFRPLIGDCSSNQATEGLFTGEQSAAKKIRVVGYDPEPSETSAKG